MRPRVYVVALKRAKLIPALENESRQILALVSTSAATYSHEHESG